MTDYLKLVKQTDNLPPDDLNVVLYGLYGEVGSLLSVVKKKKRETVAYFQYDEDEVEELGDILWYLTCTLIRINKRQLLFQNKQGFSNKRIDVLLKELAKGASDFLNISNESVNQKDIVRAFCDTYFSILKNRKIDFNDVLNDNSKKVKSRYIKKCQELDTFDDGFPKYEQIPMKFKIEFMKRKSGTQAIRWNGVFIGTPLMDNSVDQDGYRFHDVFHLSYAAVLHWSPTFRSLIQHKRKSKPEVDQTEDSGRAIVVEEGLSAWIFNLAKDKGFFARQEKLSFNMLKNVQRMVKGFEVENCPLWLWEKAILNGYEVFREVSKHGKGVVIGDRKKREIRYERIVK